MTSLVQFRGEVCKEWLLFMIKKGIIFIYINMLRKRTIFNNVGILLVINGALLVINSIFLVNNGPLLVTKGTLLVSDGALLIISGTLLVIPSTFWIINCSFLVIGGTLLTISGSSDGTFLVNSGTLGHWWYIIDHQWCLVGRVGNGCYIVGYWSPITHH